MVEEKRISEDNLEFVGKTPWQGFGETLPKKASLEDWQKVAGLNWKLLKLPALFIREGLPVEVPNYDVLYRSDTGIPLSVVSKGTHYMQPGLVLKTFVELIDAFQYQLEAAGCLHEGRKIWVLARTGLEGEVLKDDTVKSYLLLSVSYDGSFSPRAMLTFVRHLCNNMLQCYINPTDEKVNRSRHVRAFNPFLVDEAPQFYIDQFASSFAAFISDMRKLAMKPLSKEQAETLVAHLFAHSKSRRPRSELKGFKKIMELFNGAARGSDKAGVQGTAWGLINAVTEYADYYAAAKTRSNRLFNAWFGRTANMKEQLVRMLLAA